MDQVSTTVADFEDAVSKYHDGSMGRRGKTWILMRYQERFPNSGSDDTFRRMVTKDPLGRKRVPSPEEETFIIETINDAWKQFRKHTRPA